MGLLYIAAGIYHLVSPETYLRIMPPWLPAHKFLVLLSGITEVLLGLLIIHPFTRTRAAWGIILLLIAVFPANIQMMLNYWRENSPLLWGYCFAAATPGSPASVGLFIYKEGSIKYSFGQCLSRYKAKAIN